MIAILDPNREVAAQYVAYLIETKDGQSLLGIIASDMPTSITHSPAVRTRHDDRTIGHPAHEQRRQITDARRRRSRNEAAGFGGFDQFYRAREMNPAIFADMEEFAFVPPAGGSSDRPIAHRIGSYASPVVSHPRFEFHSLQLWADAGHRISAGAGVTKFLARRVKLDPEIFVNAGMIALIAGVVGARMSHVLENFHQYTDPSRSIFGEFLGCREHPQRRADVLRRVDPRVPGHHRIRHL